LTFDSPANSGQDFEYRIEARVTDASRREIVGNGTVRVTRQRYYVYLQPGHNLYHPQDKVAIDVKALDANEQPVQTEGSIKLTRDIWYEIWLSPDGREVKGEALRKLRANLAIFPPIPKTNENGWRLKASGYEHEDIFTRSLKTDTNGAAQLTFTPEREGYYRVAWTSTDLVPNTKRSSPIHAETAVWVAERGTQELGYHTGGLEIVVDKDTFRVGQKAPVMLVTQSNDRNVLFTAEGEELYSYQVVHLDGTVKLLEIPITEDHVPNIILGAAMAADRQVFMDSKPVVVPPTKNFLTVDVEPDRTVHEPREQGTFVITARDDRGKPVSAEVAFSLVDQSVYYIQQDYAGDPRQFFFGTRRNHAVQTQTTLNYRQFEKLVRDKEGALKSEWFSDDLGRDRRADYYYEGDKRREGEANRFYKLSAGELSDAASVSGGRPMVAAKSMRFPMGAAATAAPMEQSMAMLDAKDLNKKNPDQPEAPVQVRSDFRSTIVWQPDVKTDGQGHATVKVTYPDSLTTWKAQARAITVGNQFGTAETNSVTRQPFMVRLQAPRFFVVGDKVTLSALVNNDTDEEQSATVNLEFSGGLRFEEIKPVRVVVPAHGSARADWLAAVSGVGEVKLKVTARAGKHADAMGRTYSAYEHGIEKFVSKSGKSRADDLTIPFELPSQRKAGSTQMTVQVSPSLAVTMLDALPYLIDYPYGCTEQTMSRFLPTVITARTLKQLGLAPEDIAGRIFGGVEVAHASATHPKGKQDLEKIEAMVKAGLDRLYDFQHGDGGWGWWKQGESDHWMTAYVVWGLTLAHDADVQVRQDVLSRAVSYLEKTLVEEEQSYDMQAWMLHAVAVHKASFKQPGISKFEQKAFDNLWNNKDALNAYSRALFALAAHTLGKAEQAKILVENLQNGVKQDERPDESALLGNQTKKATETSLGTAHWGEDGIYWRWSEGGVEATAFALRALLAIDPQSKLVEPVTNWLIKNRRGAQWNSTRDTAIVVLAMNDYLRASGELSAEMEYELIVNDTSVASKKLGKEDLLSAPSRFQIAPELVKDTNDVRIRRKSGSGAIYFAVEAKFFSLEEPITAAGNEIFVRREYSKLVGHPTLLKGYVYDKQALRDGDSVRSGERIETVITIEGKNNYEYLVFEDLKPAGFEMVEVRSGESVYARELKSGAVDRQFKSSPTNTPAAVKSSAKSARARGTSVMPRIPNPNVSDENYTGRQRWVYQELRDRKVALFIDKLPEGVWEIRYDARAEVPGEFHALPVSGYAMYVPEIRCNGTEVRVKVIETSEK
jgi:uncharacterized protein YfaS (alpha-2-macroglobulin family)